MSGANYRAGGTEGRPTPKDRWRTPPDLYRSMDARFRFELDAACDSDNQLAPSGLCRDLGHDALAEPWQASSVWCNPPYSKVEPWTQKAVTESRLRGCLVAMLIPADVSVGWWGRWVAPHATRVEFVSQRLRFLTPEGGEHRTKRSGGGLTTPSAIVIYTAAGGPPSYGYVNRQGERVQLSEQAGQIDLGLTPSSPERREP